MDRDNTNQGNHLSWLNTFVLFFYFYVRIKIGGIIMKKSQSEEFTPDLMMKYEIAEELGLIDKVKNLGWGGLSAKETGRIGGLMAVRKKELRRSINDTQN